MIEQYAKITKVTNSKEAPRGFIKHKKALKFGRVANVTTNADRFPIGEVGACWNNILKFSYEESDVLYCLGFAAGFRGKYEPHAWVKSGNQYFEVSPQITDGQVYIVCYEDTFANFELLNNCMTGKNIIIAPMIDSKGYINVYMEEHLTTRLKLKNLLLDIKGISR